VPQLPSLQQPPRYMRLGFSSWQMFSWSDRLYGCVRDATHARLNSAHDGVGQRGFATMPAQHCCQSDDCNKNCTLSLTASREQQAYFSNVTLQPIMQRNSRGSNEMRDAHTNKHKPAGHRGITAVKQPPACLTRADLIKPGCSTTVAHRALPPHHSSPALSGL
jgi:hypothetical protein